MKRKQIAILLGSFAFTLTATLASLMISNPYEASASTQVLLDENTVWRYLDDNTDPAAGLDSLQAWTLKDFDDSEWKTGSGSFGSKNGAIDVVNGLTPSVLLNHYKADGTTCIPSYFFRTSFEIEDAEAISSLTFSANADDAVVMYINGTAVRDSRVGTPSTSTNLQYYEGTWDQNFSINMIAFPGLLVDGENTFAVQLHNNQKASSDLYFAIHSMKASTAVLTAPVAEQVILGIGANETQRQLSWVSAVGTSSEVQVAKAKDVKDGVFPTEYASFSSTYVLATNKVGYSAYDATITGLEENTEYVYRIVSTGRASDMFYFHTGSFGDYEFVFVGDPQLQTAAEGEYWKDTLVTIDEEFNTPFIISAGDQICTPNSEAEYGYFIADEMAGTAFAPSIGPHHDDRSGMSPSYKDHYNVPNESTAYGVSTSGGNYWYTYNNTLFMHLNMADTAAPTNGEHKAFMQEAMAANPDVTWNFVVMHTSLFSTGSHSDPNGIYFNGEIGVYRPKMAPIFTSLGIDVVLSGHDHVYVRSHMMKYEKVSSDKVYDSNTVYQPEGTLYLCANSSTGTKFYDSYGDDYFIAYQNTVRRKSAVKFSITDEAVVMQSYFLDDMTVFDTFTISNETAPDHVCELKKVRESAASCGVEGKAAHYLCKCGKRYEDKAGTVEIIDFESWGILPALEHSFTVKATCTTPQACENCGLTQGEALGHKFAAATCTNPQTCENCGLTQGEALGHKFATATCTTPKTCETCGLTQGEALGHKFASATCTTPKTCETCGLTQGESLGHQFAAATCTTAKTCETCGLTQGEALGHQFAAATCTMAKTCETCGLTQGEALGHQFAAATCTTAKTCETCGLTQGEALGHQFAAATCTTAKTCANCGLTQGEALGHKAGEERFSDENGHWHVCETCEGKVGVEGHVDIDENEKCDVCDYVMPKKSDGYGFKVAIIVASSLLLAGGVVLIITQQKRRKLNK